MTRFLTHRRSLAAVPAVLALIASQASAVPAYQADEAADGVQVAAADCYSVGEQVAQQYGGTLAKASASNRGGQTVCHIVVLVPGKDGQRPRRMQVDVPAG
jgi:hypothetical protein